MLRKLLLAAAALYFLFAASTNLSLPGVGVDEALWLKIVSNPFRHEFVLGDGYGGSLLAFLALPIQSFLKNTVITLRVLGLIIGMATLFTSYLVTRQLFDKRAATLTVILLATDHNYIICARTLPWGEVMLQVFLATLWIFLAIKGIKSKSRILLFSAGFTAGLAIWAKLMALGPVIAVAAALTAIYIFYPQKTKLHTQTLKGGFFTYLAGLLTGILPFIYSNIAQFNRSPLLKCVTQAARGQETNGWDNFAVAANFLTRIRHLFEYLSFKSSFYLTDFLSNSAPAAFLLLALAGLVIYLAILPANINFPKNRVCFIIVASLSLLASTCFTPSAARVSQMQIMFPFIQILIAVFAVVYYDYTSHKRFFALTVVAYLALAVVLSITTTYYYQKLLNKYGVTCDFHISSALTPVAQYLNTHDLNQNAVIISQAGLKNLALYNACQNSYSSALTGDIAVYETNMPLTEQKPFYIIILDRQHPPQTIPQRIPPNYSSLHILKTEDIYFGCNVFFCWKKDLLPQKKLKTSNYSQNLKKAKKIKRILENKKWQKRKLAANYS